MNFLSCSAAALVLAVLGSSAAHAFDTQTHAYLTYQAFLASNLGNAATPPLLQQLGLDRFDAAQPFSPYWTGSLLPVSFYFDNTATPTDPLQFARPITSYEWIQMQQLALAGSLGAASSTVVGPNSVQTLPIANWLMRGAIREDDLTADFYDPRDGSAPDPDPLLPFVRPFNHFYDPIHNMLLHIALDCSSGLFPKGSGFCSKSIDWALGTADVYASTTPDSNRHNHFSWADARNNYFWALTAERDPNGNGVREASERAADSQERMFRWATTFRSLGDVVHLLQDAAQPQHTRNDRHDTHVNPADQQGFEPYTNARAIGITAAKSADPSGGQKYVRSLIDKEAFIPTNLPLLGLSGYALPAFATPLRFFTTRAAGDTETTPPDARYGIADYSNKGFFTRGTTPDANTSNAGVFTYPRPDPSLTGFTPQATPCPELPALNGMPITCTTYYHTVPDPVQPTRSDATTAQPLLADGVWKGFFGSSNQYTLTPQIYRAMGDLTVPRAIGYTAGLINYFFRGQLAVSPPADKTVAVLNQGEPHTMNAEGYPCAGTATTDGCAVFGFQYVRLNVLNSTPALTESGTGTVIPQNLAATATGDVKDTGFHGPYLIAVAKYHRNTCYKPDLSGQRVQSYASSPSLIIAEPVCGAGQVVRTSYQEVSVSQSIAATAATLNGTTATEFKFDFTADPIPVNATDLFVQVVYRGPMGDATLGQEPDAIAVGILDVREPTFVAFWDNTDYFWNGAWFAANALNPHESARDFWFCGSGFPPKLLFEYYGAVGTPAMLDPLDGSGSPGQVRLGLIYPPPVGASQFIARGTPVPYPTGSETPIPLRSTSTTGGFQQANKEEVLAATLAAPYQNCGSALPGVPEYWCDDTVLKRRGQIFGRIAQSLYLFVSDDAGDVDAPPALPAFSGIHVLSTGTNRFNSDTSLITCPAQPSALSDPNYPRNIRTIELIEEAHALGVPVGDEK